jgi:sporulation protein YlmC with PRC-barrel domain
MLISHATGRKVVSLATAETVGKVHEFLVDPAERKVVGLELKKTDNGDTLRWSDLAAFGTDAVTVADAERIGEPDEHLTVLADKHHRPIGKRVLSSTGDELGELADLDFDENTGAVLALIVGDQHIEGSRLLGIGTYAVVIAAAKA